MINPYILWALGLFLILLEFYLPGAVMGIAGAVMLVASVFMFGMNSDSVLLFVLYILAVLITVGLLIRFALWKIKSTKPEYSIYSDTDQQGFVASRYDTHAIGKTGIVLSDLKPGGYIVIDGKQHQAISLSGYITKGSEVLVTGGQEESLLVKAISQKN